MSKKGKKRVHWGPAKRGAGSILLRRQRKAVQFALGYAAVPGGRFECLFTGKALLHIAGDVFLRREGGERILARGRALAGFL